MTTNLAIHIKPLNNYTFYPNVDSNGFDVLYSQNASFEDLKKICDEDDCCIAFNTYGWIKYRICDKLDYTFLKQDNNKYVDGLYVKNKGYYFCENTDVYECNITHNKNKTIQELKELCDKDDNCLCFNTFGVMKCDVDIINYNPLAKIELQYSTNKSAGLYINIEKYNKLCDYYLYNISVEDQNKSLSSQNYSLSGSINKIPKIYCINLLSRPDRKNRMKSQFTTRGLIDKIEFINAVTKNQFNNNNDLTNAQHACFTSHLKALKTFLDTDEESCIVCEDDLLIHKNFINLCSELIDNLPNNIKLCLLSYLPTNIKLFKAAGKNPSLNNVYYAGPKSTWGTQMYYITRIYAKECIQAYDKPGFGMDGASSEAITRFVESYVVPVPLALEDCISSNIGNGSYMNYHILVFKKHNYFNYSMKGDILSSLNPFSLIQMKNIHNTLNRIIYYRNNNNKEFSFKLAKKMLEYLYFKTLKMDEKYIKILLNEIEQLIKD